MKKNYETYDCFVGNISPFLLFEMEYHSLFYIVENHKEDKFYPEINPASQIASIGLLAYFEAFCKHQFAAIVNLMPSLLKDFCLKRGELKVEFSTIASFNGDFENNIGFALAEIYDFGTAMGINSIFRDLLLITPFSKEEESKFNSIVYNRNLLVHHAGYYTLQYLNKNALQDEILQKAFKNTVKIDTVEYLYISDFLFEMAMKITRASVKAVKAQSDFNILSSERINAIEELLQGLYDTLKD